MEAVVVETLWAAVSPSGRRLSSAGSAGLPRLLRLLAPPSSGPVLLSLASSVELPRPPSLPLGSFLQTLEGSVTANDAGDGACYLLSDPDRVCASLSAVCRLTAVDRHGFFARGRYPARWRHAAFTSFECVSRRRAGRGEPAVADGGDGGGVVAGADAARSGTPGSVGRTRRRRSGSRRVEARKKDEEEDEKDKGRRPRRMAEEERPRRMAEREKERQRRSGVVSRKRSRPDSAFLSALVRRWRAWAQMDAALSGRWTAVAAFARAASAMRATYASHPRRGRLSRRCHVAGAGGTLLAVQPDVDEDGKDDEDETFEEDTSAAGPSRSLRVPLRAPLRVALPAVARRLLRVFEPVSSITAAGDRVFSVVLRRETTSALASAVCSPPGSRRRGGRRVGGGGRDGVRVTTRRGAGASAHARGGAELARRPPRSPWTRRRRGRSTWTWTTTANSPSRGAAAPAPGFGVAGRWRRRRR